MNLGTKSLSYAYDGANRLTGISGSQARTFGYDARGNVTSNGLRGFTYNNANQLVASGTVSVAYDGNGLRTQKKIGSSTDRFVYSLGGQLLYKRAPNGVGTNYVYLGSDLVAKVSSSLKYTSTDLLGSVALETTSTGGVSKRYHYEPFGRALETGQQDDPGYTGHLFDDDLGLNYMKARYYDPLIGRFYSNDPVGFRGTHSFNRYAYVNNNPFRYIDPDGRTIRSRNAADNRKLEAWINFWTTGTFEFNKNGELEQTSEKRTGKSEKFTKLLNGAIASSKAITIGIGETGQVNKNSFYVSDKGEGATVGRPGGLLMSVTLTGRGKEGITNRDGAPLEYGPADILLHELAGHAIPLLTGDGKGNAIKNENSIRRQHDPSDAFQRQNDVNHKENYNGPLF